MSRSGVWISLLLLSAMQGCGPDRTRYVGGVPREGVPFEEVTLQNVIRWPSGQEYIEGVGVGRAPESETDVSARRLASRDAASLQAQEILIRRLSGMVPRTQVRELLRKVEVAKMEYGYDDTCTLTLRIPKEAVTGKPPIE